MSEPTKSAIRVSCRDELNDFLPSGRKQKSFLYEFNGSPRAFDVFQAVGVPHTEIGAVIQNGQPFSIESPVRHGCHYLLTPVRGERPKRFILDVHLGKLARSLRLFGFDTVYRNDFSDRQIADAAAAGDHMVLTRDVGLLKRRRVARGYWLRSSRPDEQMREVSRRFHLAASARPFCLCLQCNGVLVDVSAAEVFHELPRKTRETFHHFRRCSACGKIYWQGSHHAELVCRVRNWMQAA